MVHTKSSYVIVHALLACTARLIDIHTSMHTRKRDCIAAPSPTAAASASQAPVNAAAEAKKKKKKIRVSGDECEHEEGEVHCEREVESTRLAGVLWLHFLLPLLHLMNNADIMFIINGTQFH